MLKQFLANLMNKNESSISNRYIADMKIIHKDLYDIRKSLSELTDIDYAGDIADKISTYEIARNIEIDVTDIDIDYDALARHLGDNIDTTGIADDVVSQIETTLEIQYQNMITVNMNNRLNDIEKKMDLILKHLGIPPENAYLSIHELMDHITN